MSSFFAKFHKLREKRLPIRSPLYDGVEERHDRQRKLFEEYARLPMPEGIRLFYNARFSEVSQLVDSLPPKGGLTERLKERARRAYACRIPGPATFGDLFSLDVFA